MASSSFAGAMSKGKWGAHTLSHQQPSLTTSPEQWPSLDGLPPPPPTALKRETSELSERGRELLNQALGFHEWQDRLTQPMLNRSTSQSGSQAASGISGLSRGTSEFTVDSTIHLRKRMDERVITKRELQSARKHGTMEIGENGMVKLTHNATTLILNPKTHKGITAYPTRDEDSTVWAAVKSQMKRATQNENQASEPSSQRNEVDMMTMQRFRDMGFDDRVSTEAYLKANGNFREAVEDLLSQPVAPPPVVDKEVKYNSKKTSNSFNETQPRNNKNRQRRKNKKGFNANGR